MQQKIEYKKLITGYEFAPTSFILNSKAVMSYLKATEDSNRIYADDKIAPPMVIAALAMSAMSAQMELPPGTIHISQELKFMNIAHIDETLTSYAEIINKTERGKFHMLTFGIDVQNRNKKTVISGETCFILPLS